MNTMYKYRPKSLAEFVFHTPFLEQEIMRYANRKSKEPLILHGPPGSGKSLLAELIPKEMEGSGVLINHVNADQLSKPEEVRQTLLRNEHFDKLLCITGQDIHYTIVEEFISHPKAISALRVCLDEMTKRGLDLYIFTTNDLSQVDPAIQSRSKVLEVLPAPPEKFFPRAKLVIQSEGFVPDEPTLLRSLQATYLAKGDNRHYYRDLDTMIESMRSSRSM